MRSRALCLFCCLLAAAGVLFSGCSKGPAQPAGQSGAPPAANAAAQPKDVEAFGTVISRKTRDLILDYPAMVEKKLVVEGQRVKRGDELFLLSSEDYTAQLDAISLEILQANLDLKKAGSEKERLQEELAMAGKDVEKAQKDVDAKKRMFGIGAAPASDVEDLARALDVKTQAVKTLERQLAQYPGNMDMQRARIANLEDQERRLSAKASRSFVNGDAIVCDVDDGIVFDIGYAEGDFVSRERKLCSLLDATSMVVEANVTEEFIKDVRLGARAEITPLADNTRTYTGKVTRISSLATRVNGETVVPVDVSIEKPDGFLRPNYNVDVKIY